MIQYYLAIKDHFFHAFSCKITCDVYETYTQNRLRCHYQINKLFVVTQRSPIRFAMVTISTSIFHEKKKTALAQAGNEREVPRKYQLNVKLSELEETLCTH